MKRILLVALGLAAVVGSILTANWMRETDVEVPAASFADASAER